MLLSGRWLREMGGSESVLGWFSASVVPGIILGALLAGRLATHTAEKHLIIAGLTLVGGTSLVFAQFEQISFWLVPLRCLQGLGHGAVFTSLFSLAAHTIPDTKKAQGIGYVALAAQLGNVSGVSLAEWLVLHSGFALAFTCAAALTAAGLIGALGLPTGLSTATTGTTPAAPTPAVPKTWHITLSVAFFFILGGSYGTVLQCLPLLVQDIARSTGESSAATPVMATIFLTVAACRLFLAKLADGRHRRAVLIGVMLLLMLASASWPFATSVKQLMLIAVFFALGYGLLFPGLNGLVLNHVASNWRSRAAGWIVMAFDGGFFGLLLVLGPVADYWGYHWMFALLVGLQLLFGLAFLRLTRR